MRLCLVFLVISLSSCCQKNAPPYAEAPTEASTPFWKSFIYDQAECEAAQDKNNRLPQPMLR